MNSELLPFSSIKWGEDEARKDKDLDKYFVPPPDLPRIEDGSIQFIIGRKGTGKSAIFQFLRLRYAGDPMVFFREVNLRSFPVGLLRSMEDRRMIEKAKFTPIWKYVILVELCAMIDQNESLGLGRVRSEIKQFLSSNHLEALTPVETLTHLKERGLKLNFASTGPSVNMEEKALFSAAHEISYQKVCESLIKIIKTISNEHRYYLFIDGLDEGYKAADSSTRLVLLSLIRAVDEIRESFRDVGVQVFPIAAFRSDIWNGLHDNDLNKYHDYSVQLKWNPAHDSNESSLRSVVNFRIANHFGLSAAESDLWLKFAQDRDPQIPMGKTLWQYLCARTFDRPRDILKFLKIISAKVKPQRLTYRSVSEAERDYSDWLYNELKDEASAHFPCWKQLLDCVSRTGRIYIDSGLTLIDQINNDPILKEWIGGSKVSGLELAEALFEFGVIGNVQSNDYFVFRHKNEDTRFDPLAKVVVQFGLIKKLSVR